MKHLRYIGLLVLSLLLAACSTSGTPESQLNKRFVPYPEESQLLGLTNDFRSQTQTCGTQKFFPAPALTWVEAVGDSSWYHSVDMGLADSENHTGASTVDRLKARGFDPGAVAEFRKSTALPPNSSDAFNAWKANPLNCALLMNPNFTVMGAGMFGFYEQSQLPNIALKHAYWTQILSTPKTASPAKLILNIDQINTSIGAGPAPFTAIQINGTDTINWSLSGPGSLSSTTGPATSYIPPSSGSGGTATLTVTAGSLSSSATINLQGSAAPTLTLTPVASTAKRGGASITLTAKLSGATTSQFEWSMTGPGNLIKFLNTGGPIDTGTAVYEPPETEVGIATITVKAAGLTATATVNVDSCQTNICVNPKTASTRVNAAPTTFTATTNSANPITWSLSPGCGTLSATTGPSVSYIPPQTLGSVVLCPNETLTATVDGSSSSALISLSNTYPPPSLSVTPSTAATSISGAAVNFTASFTNIYSFPIVWSLSGPGSFTSSGNTATYIPPVTGTPGTATLTAKATEALSGVSVQASATITINAAPPTGINEQMLTLINQFRSQTQTCGTDVLPAVPPLTLDAKLIQAAVDHSLDMATRNYFAHVTPEGVTPKDRVAAAGYTGSYVGENAAAGYTTAKDAFDGWRNAPDGHCQLLMNPNANEMGLGAAFNPDSQWQWYWTLDMGHK